MEEDFSLLENIVQKNIAETSDPAKFNWTKFIAEMEVGFTELGFRESSTGGVDNILIARIGGGVGDFVLMTAAIREIRRNFPRSKITLCVTKRLYLLAEKSPYVNNVLVLDEHYGNDLKKIMDFCKIYLWNHRYSHCFILKSTTEWLQHLFAYMSGARERINYVHVANRIYTNRIRPKDKNLSYYMLTSPVLYPKNIIHEVDRHLYILKAYGLNVQNINAELWYDCSDLFIARNLLENFAKNKVRIALNIGTSSGQAERRYPIEQYLSALKSIVKMDGAVIILGGPKEAEDAKFLQDNLPTESVLNLIGKTSGWRVDIAVMSQMDMYIGNFTGMCDITAALHIPSIAISREAKDRPAEFNGISQFYRFYPWQTNAIVLQPQHPMDSCVEWSLQFYHASSCNHNKQPHCITQIVPEEIVEAYAEMVNFIKNAKKFGGFPSLRNIKPITSADTLANFKRQKSFSEIDYKAAFAVQFNFVKGA